VSPDEIRSYKASGRSGRHLAETGAVGYRYTVGYITTPYGVVGIYMERNHTSAVIVLGGREHRGFWRRDFTERGLVAACRRFAARMADSKDGTTERPGTDPGRPQTPSSEGE
jgi:hypothetical protein